MLTPSDLPAEDLKARAALGRYRLSLVRSPLERAFEEAYTLLDAEFGAKGELESRAAYHAYFAVATETRGLRLVVARDQDGTIAAVRDFHISVADGIVVVFLSHVLVLPAHRRAGLGSLMRHLPAALGSEAARSLPSAEVLLAAEMEPFRASAEDTLARLVAYGRAGFRVIDPHALPYLQPDYRAHDVIDRDRVRPVPLLAVARWLGHEGDGLIPKRLARAWIERLYEGVAVHCRDRDLEPARTFTRRTLEAAPGDSVGFLPLPSGIHDAKALAALAEERLIAIFPRELVDGREGVAR